MTACSSENNNIELQIFESKKEAINKSFDDSLLQGFIYELTVSDNVTLLLFEQRKNTYFVGELISKDGKFSATKITPGVESPLGASWEMKTVDGRIYTINISKSKEEDDAILIKEAGVYVKISKGTLSSVETNKTTNLIQSYTVLKSPGQ